jgi:hypothetical protein
MLQQQLEKRYSRFDFSWFVSPKKEANHKPERQMVYLKG